MAPMTLNARHARSLFALRSLQLVCLLMSLGSCYGLFVAGPAGLLSPVEWISIPPMLLTGVILFGLLAWRGTLWLERIALGLSIWLSLYVVGNVTNALFLTDDPDKVFVHLAWVIPLYLFEFAVNSRRHAFWIAGLTAAAIVLALAVYLLLHASAGSSRLDAMVSLILAQGAAVMLIGGVTSFREISAAEAAAMETLADSNVRITVLAERLSTSEARARRLMELAPDVPGLVDKAGRLIEIGPNCRDIWGLEREALIGRPLASLFAAGDQAVVTARLSAARMGAPHRMQPGRIRHADGYEQPVLWSVAWSEADAQYFIWAQAAE